MSERFGFAKSWREIYADHLEREYAAVHWWPTYEVALQHHRDACRGGWVTEVMVDPQVGALIGHDDGGKQRTIRAEHDLWRDDRPPFGKDDFGRLWREWSGKADPVAAV